MAPVLFKDVSLSRSNDAYQVGADSFLDAVDEKGGLLLAVKHYVNFLEANGRIADKKVTMTAQYTVEFDKIEVPVTGSFPIVVHVP